MHEAATRSLLTSWQLLSYQMSTLRICGLRRRIWEVHHLPSQGMRAHLPRREHQVPHAMMIDDDDGDDDDDDDDKGSQNKQPASAIEKLR